MAPPLPTTNQSSGKIKKNARKNTHSHSIFQTTRELLHIFQMNQSDEKMRMNLSTILIYFANHH